MNKPIYVVGGSKGGVGKSMVSMGLTHFPIESGEKVFLIDADTSNPDVFKSYKDEVDSEIVNLDDADGWVRFVDICYEHKDSTVFRRACHASISATSRSQLSMRRSRHWPLSTPISISTMLSQLACLGVQWNSRCLSTRRASAGGNAA